MKILKATKKNVHIANSFLEKIIKDEFNYDNNINKNYKTNNFYNDLINNEDSLLIYAYIDNVVVGYLYAYIDRNSVYINPKAKLDAMYVEENYRNKKVATGLITYFENWVEEKNITIIEVSVCVLNNKALNLYMKTGYQEYKKILYKKN